MPPVTPRSTTGRSAMKRSLGRRLPVGAQLVGDLASGRFGHGDAQIVLREIGDRRRRKGVKPTPLAQAVVVRVDLAGPFGRDHDRRVAVGLLDVALSRAGKTFEDLSL